MISTPLPAALGTKMVPAGSGAANTMNPDPTTPGTGGQGIPAGTYMSDPLLDRTPTVSARAAELDAPTPSPA